MAIINFLQRHCKAATRALIESALDIKELGANEEAIQPELIYKKSDSSGYLHLAALEWLNGFVDNKGGARQIGVEDDSFTNLTGDTHLQAVIKQIDGLLTSAQFTSGTFQMPGDPGPWVSTPTVNCEWRKTVDGYIDITIKAFTGTFIAVSPGSIYFNPDAAFAAAGLVPATERRMAVDFDYDDVADRDIGQLILTNNSGDGRFEFAYKNDFPGASATMTVKQQTVRYKLADVA